MCGVGTAAVGTRAVPDRAASTDDRTATLAALHATVFGKPEPTPPAAPKPLPAMLSDDWAVIEKARFAKGGEKFSRLADRVTRANELYHVGLEQRAEKRKQPGDDDGSFVKAGYPAAIANLGSFPYSDPNYHEPGDTADKVDVPNVCMAAQAILAAALIADRDGAA